MPRFLVDEDLPRSLALALRAAGHEAYDVRDVGLRGCSDDAILARARAEGWVVVTGDGGFGNLLRYPLGSSPGVVVVRFPLDLPVPKLNSAIAAALAGIAEDELRGALAVIEPGRTRLRRPD